MWGAPGQMLARPTSTDSKSEDPLSLNRRRSCSAGGEAVDRRWALV